MYYNVLFLSIGGGLVYLFLMALSMGIINIIWYNTPFL